MKMGACELTDLNTSEAMRHSNQIVPEITNMNATKI